MSSSNPLFYVLSWIIACLFMVESATAQNGLTAPENLHVEITGTDENNVQISWTFSNYGAAGFEGFNLYRNDSAINSTLLEESNYSDEGLELGTYTYEAQAVYSSGTSSKTNPGVVTIRQGYFFDIGSGDPSFATWSIFINSSTLGQEVLSPGDEIAIFDGDVNTGSHKILDEPYAGDDNLIELVSFSQFAGHDGYEPGNPYTFKLYDASYDTVYSEYMANFDDSSDDFYVGEVFPGSSDPLSLIDLNFSLGLPQPINLEVSNEDHDIILEWDIEEEDDGTLIGYNVYRDGEKITETPVDTTTHADEQMLSGTYEYYVVAVYEEGTSIPSNTVEFTLGTVFFNPPDAEGNLTSPMTIYIHGASIMENSMVAFDEIGVFRRTDTDTLCMGAISLKQVIESETPDSIMVYADDPGTDQIEGFETGNTLYYRLYDYDQSIEYTDPLVELNSLYGNTSDTYSPNTNNHLSLSWLPFSPVNLSAEVEGYDITLSWEEHPDNPGLSLQGYQLFKDGAPVNQELLEDTSYTDEGLLVDDYDYYVRAIYQESVSRNSDTITAIIPTQYFTPLSENESPGKMTFYITEALIDGENLETYDEVGIFASSGSEEICVGAGSLHGVLSENSPMKVTTYRDDPNTDIKDGFEPGDSIRYKFYYNTTENYYNTIQHAFPYDAGQGYNFEEFSDGDTCYVNLSFNTPPPVKFYYQAQDYCNNETVDLYVTVEDFQKINELHLGIAMDTASYSYQSIIAVPDFINDIEVTDQEDTIRVDWASENSFSLSEGDTLFNISIQTKSQGESNIGWTNDSYSVGMEYQGDEFFSEAFYINDNPEPASSISGDGEVCNGTTYSDYSVSPIEGASAYEWQIEPENAGTVQPNGPSCQVVWNDGFADEATLSVYGINECGVGESSEKTIAISNTVYVDVTISTESEYQCEGDTIHIIADAENPGNNPNYEWYINNELTYETSNILTETNFSDGDEVYCEVESSQMCAENNPATSNTITLEIDPLPARPEIIAGDTIMCNTIQYSEYITPGSAFSEEYDWNLEPEGSGVVNCLNDNCQEIMIEWNTEFQGMTALWVRGVNDCGMGPYIASPHNIFRDYCTSVDDFKADGWQIFPNPAQNVLKIKQAQQTNYTWSLVSASGQVLQTGQSSDAINKISLKSIAPGIYFVRIRSLENVFIRKVIKR